VTLNTQRDSLLTMTPARSPSTTIALAIALVVFFTSVWHLKPWNSVDLSSFKGSSVITDPVYVDNTSQTTHVELELEEMTDDEKNAQENIKGGTKEEDTEKDTTPPPLQNKPSTSNREHYCKWIFDKYQSSPYEEEWFKEVPNVQSVTAEGPNICKAMQAEKHVAASLDIVGRVVNLTSIDPKVQWATYDTIAKTSAHPADKYMSRMYYKRVCYDEEKEEFLPAPGHGIQLIEPLFGMLRDPFDIFCGSDKLTMENYKGDNLGQSKLHIMPQGYAPYTYTIEKGNVQPAEWRSHGIPPWHSSLKPLHDDQVGTTFEPPQNIHLDLGASYFGGWTQSAREGQKNPAASGEWVYDTYHSRGQKFNRFVAVEVEILDDATAYEQVPEDLVGIYTLMNIPLTMGDDKLNTIEMIKRIVKPEDFFVFKLDIDSAPIEEPIVPSLLADDPNNGGASGLIDELMFEHHVNFYPMNGPWQTGGEKADLLSSYKLFRDLRRKGIRSHSWP
jgi:hypothetical protein